MRTLSLSLFCLAIPVLISVPTPGLAEDNAPWTVATVPSDDWGGFFAYYQRFLRERLPRSVRNTNDKAADHEAKLANHRELAALTARLSEVCNGFAHSAQFSDVADPAIKKETQNKIAGTWNFYRNIPPNAADLWQEACYLRFLSLLHESEVDFDRLGQVREYADQLAEFETLQKLHVHIKRVWYAKTLDCVEKDSDFGLQASGSEYLAEAIRDFRPFLMRHLSVEHIDLAERFVIVSGLCPTNEISELLHSLVDDLPQSGGHVAPQQKKHVTALPAGNAMAAGNGAQRSDRTITPNDPVTPFAALTTFPAANELNERIELLKGLLRRQELIGKPMPVWGVDLAGNVFDESTLEGKVVLLDFWATWCTPCVAEFPHLKNLYEKYHARGFEIISYNVDSDLDDLTAFLERRPLPWPVLVREKSRVQDTPPLSTYYGARKLPVVLLRDRHGKVISLDARGNVLDEILERLFK